MECLPQDLLDFPLLSPLLSPSSCAGAKQIDVRIQLCECVCMSRIAAGHRKAAMSRRNHCLRTACLSLKPACLPVASRSRSRCCCCRQR